MRHMEVIEAVLRRAGLSEDSAHGWSLTSLCTSAGKRGLRTTLARTDNYHEIQKLEPSDQFTDWDAASGKRGVSWVNNPFMSLKHK